MKITWAVLLTVLYAIVGISEGRDGFGPGEQEFGYVDVRPGAHMFYWLHYTRETSKRRPLVMWLEGGPGPASTSYGNFKEIGPLTVDLKPRNTTWIKYVDLLFVDSPVGSGFSYVDDKTLFATTNQQIGADLVELMQGFIKAHPMFRSAPFYIFSQSYGGKMAAEFALQLEKEIDADKIDVNFKGFALGDPWISPVDSVLTWAPYLYQTGLVNQKGFEEVDKYAKRTAKAVEMGNFIEATALYVAMEQIILQQAGNVDPYNILTPVRTGLRRPGKADDKALQDLLDGPVRMALGIPENVRHESQRESVFNYLREDFMKPAILPVEELLNKTSLYVAIYTGQLDLMVDPPGTVQWVDKMNWRAAWIWDTTYRGELTVNGIVEGFVKKYDRLSLYWINRAGHMVPADNPAAALEVLIRLTRLFVP